MTKSVQLSLETPGGNYHTEGETVFEALNAIPLDYTQVKHKGTIKVTRGEKSFERLFPLLPLRRLFANKLYKEHWAYSVEKFIN